MTATMDEIHDVAIVGGGASGALLAMHLVAAGDPPRIAIVERSGTLARGLAYRSRDPLHLLNTRMRDMSVWPDRPGDFSAWLAERAPGSGDFIARSVYGDYLEARFAEAVKAAGDRLRTVSGEVVDIVPEGDAGYRVVLEDGAALRARHVVLATGHAPPSADTAGWLGNPWDTDAIAAIPPDGDVLLLGTGLTAVDVAISLIEQGHRGRVLAVSRRGLLPRAHASGGHGEHADIAPLFEGPLSRRLAAFRALQRHGHDWQHLMHELRPRNAELWRELDEPQRRRFLRHLRPWWDVHRHRMPPEVAERIAGAIRDGRLVLMAGRVDVVDAPAGEIRVEIHGRGTEGGEAHGFTRVIDCRGSICAPDPAIPLLAGLAEEGLLRADVLGLGVAVDDADAVLDADGAPVPGVHALGPPTRGRHWESTAIPDIRRRAAELAARLRAMLQQ